MGILRIASSSRAAISLGSAYHTTPLRRVEMILCEGRDSFVTCSVILSRFRVDDLAGSHIVSASSGCLMRLQGQMCEAGNLRSLDA